MTGQAVRQNVQTDNTIESTARALCEFVIRTLLLPITLLFTKPSKIKEAAESGAYHPLPSPFLLALVTGVLVSGFTNALFEAPLDGDESFGRFLSKVSTFYTGADGIKAILFSIPYVAAVWLMAGLMSILIGRRQHAGTALFAMLSFSFAAVAELAAVGIAGAFVWSRDAPTELDSTFLISIVAFLGYALILVVKFVRLLILLRSRNAPAPAAWSGVVVASLLAIVVVLPIGLAGGGFFGAFMTQPMASVARGNSAFAEGRYAEAIELYDRAIEANPRNAEAFFRRARAFSENGNTTRAMLDYDQAIRLNPQYAEALHWRAALHRSNASYDRSAFSRAIEDLDRVIQLNPLHSGAYFDRCLTRAYSGVGLDVALADCDEALRLDQDSQARATAARALVNLRLHDYDAAQRDYEAVMQSESPEVTEEDRADARAGRGVVQIQRGKISEGYADIIAAREVYADAGWVFGGYEIVDSGWRLIDR